MDRLTENITNIIKFLCLTFVDHEKAFDLIEKRAVLNSLPEQRINEHTTTFS